MPRCVFLILPSLPLITIAGLRSPPRGLPPRFDVDARYLFGGTAAGSPVEVSCYIEASTFKPKNNGQYEYAVFKGEDAAKRLSLGTVSAELDDQGHAEIACPASGGGGVVGPSRVVADVAVFEAGSGRTTHGSASAPVHPERYYLGLSTSADKAHSGQPVAVEGVVVDWDGNLVTDALTTLDMRYLRLEAEYNWYWYDESDE